MNRLSTEKEARQFDGILSMYPEYSPLADPEVLRSLVVECFPGDDSAVGDARITHARFSPSTGITLSFELPIFSPESNVKTFTRFYVCGVTAAGFAKLQRHAGRLEPLSSSSCRTPHINHRYRALLCEFPHDLRLPDIRVIEDRKHLSELICRRWKTSAGEREFKTNPTGEFTLLRYKPQSRLVGEFRVGREQSDHRCILRFHKDGIAGRLYKLLLNLHRQFEDESLPAVPKPLFYLPEINAFAIERVSGSIMSSVLKTDRAKEAVHKAGRTLACFHRAETPTGHELESRQFEEGMHRALSVLECCGEELKSRYRNVLEILSDMKSIVAKNSGGLVHGDFHQGQLLFDDKRVWLLDFDRSHLGDRSTDVGNFLAQLTLLRLRGRIVDEKEMRRQFLDGYRTAGGNDWPHEQLVYRYCFGLLELAAKEIRRLKPQSAVTGERIVEIVESELRAI